MKRVLFIALILSVTAFLWLKFANKDGAFHGQSSDELVVGTNATFPPFTFIHEGRLAGLDIDIMEEVARRLNKKLVWRDMPFDVLVVELQLGRFHAVAAGMTPTTERAERIDFTKPYVGNDPFVIVSSAKKPIMDINELDNKNVVVNNGFAAEQYMERLEKPRFTLKRIPTVAEAFLMLNSGRVDAYVSALCAVNPFFEQYNKDNYHVVPLENAEDKYALAVSKKYPELYGQIQKIMDDIECDGTLTALKKKWGFVHD